MLDDFVFGDTEDEAFYSFFSDSGGNRKIDALDLLVLRQSYRANTGDANFNSSVDYDSNGAVNAHDLLRLRQRYRQTLAFV